MKIACMALLSGLTLPALAAPVSTLTRTQESMLDHSALSLVPVGQSVTLEDFPLDGARSVDLDLERFSVIAPGAPMYIVDEHGNHNDVGDLGVVLLRGTVAGREGTRAFVSVSPYGTHGFVEDAGRIHSITSGPARADLADDLGLRVTDATGVPGRARPGITCATAPGVPGLDALGHAVLAPEGYAQLRPRMSLYETEVAVETDWEYVSNTFGGNVAAASAYIQTLIGGVSQIYESDVSTKLTVVWSRVFSVNNDPYTSSDPSGRLDHLKNHWDANMNGVSRDVVHMLTGVSPSWGGIAYVGALCYSVQNGMDDNYDYGVSAYLDGFFPDPLQNNNFGNWDLIVCAHELGHNHGTWHTHNDNQYNPVIDGCGLGNCSQACGATIMSYCHTCGSSSTPPPCQGGLSNIVLGFHPRVQDTILFFMDEYGTCATPTGPCGPADCDGDGVLSLDDLDCFIAAYFGGAAAADCDGNTTLNLDDLDCFVAAFSAGCP